MKENYQSQQLGAFEYSSLPSVDHRMVMGINPDYQATEDSIDTPEPDLTDTKYMPVSTKDETLPSKTPNKISKKNKWANNWKGKWKI